MERQSRLMFLSELRKIRAFFFDVDGVLTNGDITATESGEFLRTFNIKDGYALQLAVKRGFVVALISGGQGMATRRRFEGLGLQEIFLGVSDKVAVFHALLEKYGLRTDEILFMGDDMPDFNVMQLVGMPTCPEDAVPEIKALAKYISPYAGGRMAVRDVIEKTLKVQEKWHDPEPSAKDSGC